MALRRSVTYCSTCVLKSMSLSFDPKTRSMRDNPLPMENPEELPFAGDNFGRISGDAVELAKTSLFAWEADAKNQDSAINPISNPSQVEFMRKQFEEKKGKLEEDKKKAVLDKYGTGGAEKTDEGSDERRMALNSSEGYVEYSRDGRVLRGAAKAVAKSKCVLGGGERERWFGSPHPNRCP